MRRLLVFATVFLSIVILDVLWLGVIANALYNQYLFAFLRPSINLFAAAMVYFALAMGVHVFVLHHPFTISRTRALELGAIFGFVVYTVYELTNLALITNWPWVIVVIDIVWGTVVMALASFAGYRGKVWAS